MPPYVTVEVALTSPVGIDVLVAAAQAGVRETIVTVKPGAGAAVAMLLLSKLIVIGVPKLAFGLTDPWVMSSAAVVAAEVVPSR